MPEHKADQRHQVQKHIPVRQRMNPARRVRQVLAAPHRHNRANNKRLKANHQQQLPATPAAINAGPPAPGSGDALRRGSTYWPCVSSPAANSRATNCASRRTHASSIKSQTGGVAKPPSRSSSYAATALTPACVAQTPRESVPRDSPPSPPRPPAGPRPTESPPPQTACGSEYSCSPPGRRAGPCSCAPWQSWRGPCSSAPRGTCARLRRTSQLS